MSVVLQPLFVLVLGFVVYFGDTAIHAAIARDTLRAICYGVVAILALICVILMAFGFH